MTAPGLALTLQMGNVNRSAGGREDMRLTEDDESTSQQGRRRPEGPPLLQGHVGGRLKHLSGGGIELAGGDGERNKRCREWKVSNARILSSNGRGKLCVFTSQSLMLNHQQNLRSTSAVKAGVRTHTCWSGYIGSFRRAAWRLLFFEDVESEGEELMWNAKDLIGSAVSPDLQLNMGESVPIIDVSALYDGTLLTPSPSAAALATPNPVQLFRCFYYIAADDAKGGQFGIGEHSDFGLLTLLAQNGPGLQVLSPGGKWLDVPVIPGSHVVNVGDILDRLTSGLYVSPFHRAIPPAPGTDRISIPFLFDAAWNAEMVPFPLPPATKSQIPEDAEKRWTRTTFRNLEGIWGQYLGVK
ncbi:Clavaminate synthase-like protein, partial [Athelia psychrophila]